MADLHGVPHLVRYVELVRVEEEEDEVHLLGEPLQHLHVVVPAAERWIRNHFVTFRCQMDRLVQRDEASCIKFPL